MVLTIRMSEFEEPAKEAVPEVLPEVPEKREGAKSQTTGDLSFSLFDLL